MTKLKPKRRAWPERKSLHKEASSPPCEPQPSTLASQLPRLPTSQKHPCCTLYENTKPGFQPVPLLTTLEKKPKAILHLPLSMNMKLIGNHRRKNKRGSWFLNWWPYLMTFTKHGNMILTSLSESALLPMCLTFICIKKFTNLPSYSGLTNTYQISLKTNYFIFISIFSMFLPKLLEPTCTSECLTLRRYKKMFKYLEIFRAMIF